MTTINDPTFNELYCRWAENRFKLQANSVKNVDIQVEEESAFDTFHPDNTYPVIEITCYGGRNGKRVIHSQNDFDRWDLTSLINDVLSFKIQNGL